MNFIPVEDIIDFQPTEVVVGFPAPLSATVVPPNATNRTIEWSVVSGHATIAGNTLTANASVNIVVRATVRNGKLADSASQGDTQPFNITAVD